MEVEATAQSEKQPIQPCGLPLCLQIPVYPCLVFMAVLVFSLLQSRVTGSPPTIAGHHLYVVLSGSMSPTFEAGSMVVVRPVEASEIAVGDIITYREPGAEETLTTHRVVVVERENGLQFITKGDANEVIDQDPVPAENLVGKVLFAIPYAGHVADFAHQPGCDLVIIRDF